MQHFGYIANFQVHELHPALPEYSLCASENEISEPPVPVKAASLIDSVLFFKTDIQGHKRPKISLFINIVSVLAGVNDTAAS
jgi:hypothetical protein